MEGCKKYTIYGHIAVTYSIIYRYLVGGDWNMAGLFSISYMG